MADAPKTVWPLIKSAYIDEFGQIEPDVHNAAGELWHKHGESYALSMLQDSAAGRTLMLKAAAKVSRKRAEQPDHINYLKAYLFTTFKRLVLEELQKRNGHREHEDARRAELSQGEHSVVEDVDRKILIEQLCLRMDAWTRKVFELRALGYTFEKMERELSLKANAIRAKYCQEVHRLKKEIESETREAEERTSEAKESVKF